MISTSCDGYVSVETRWLHIVDTRFLRAEVACGVVPLRERWLICWSEGQIAIVDRDMSNSDSKGRECVGLHQKKERLESKLSFVFRIRTLLKFLSRFSGYKYRRPDYYKRTIQSNTKPFQLRPQTLGVGVK